MDLRTKKITKDSRIVLVMPSYKECVQSLFVFHEDQAIGSKPPLGLMSIAAYLKKTRKNYIHRIAYCIGDFRTAMEKALKIVDIQVNIVPRETTIQKMLQPSKSFIFNSLSCKEYLQDLSDSITHALKLPRRTVGIKENLLVDDTDWYII